MKKILMLVCLMLPLSLLAQDEDTHKAEIEALRVGVYTRVLSLTADEAKAFWPIFNKMDAELDAIRKQQHELRKSTKEKSETMTDKELSQAVDKMFELEQKELDVKKKYMEEFKKILPMKKVVLIPRAEHEFKRELIGRIRDRKRPE